MVHDLHNGEANPSYQADSTECRGRAGNISLVGRVLGQRSQGPEFNP